MGYRAGLHEKQIIEPKQRMLDIIDMDEPEEAPKTHEEIIADMKRAQQMIMGYDTENE